MGSEKRSGSVGKSSKRRRGSPETSGGHIEEFVDEPILTLDVIPAQPPHLTLPNYVHRLIALNRSSRSLEFTEPCLAFTRRLIARWSCSMMLFRYWTGRWRHRLRRVAS